MNTEFISLKQAFRKWLQSEGLFNPELAKKRIRAFLDEHGLESDGDMLPFPVNDLYAGSPSDEDLFHRGRLEQAGVRFGELIQETGLQLVVSNKPDSAAKIILDAGVWPEGPFCRPLAIHTRIRNHRRTDGDRRPAVMRSPLEIYDGHFVFVERENFEQWVRHLKVMPRKQRLAGLEWALKVVPKITLTKKLEDAYRARVLAHPKESPSPSLEDDWAFLRDLNPAITRRRAEEIRRKLAPENWKRRGRRPNV